MTLPTEAEAALAALAAQLARMSVSNLEALRRNGADEAMVEAARAYNAEYQAEAIAKARAWFAACAAGADPQEAALALGLRSVPQAANDDLLNITPKGTA